MVSYCPYDLNLGYPGLAAFPPAASLHLRKNAEYALCTRRNGPRAITVGMPKAA